MSDPQVVEQLVAVLWAIEFGIYGAYGLAAGWFLMALLKWLKQ